ncbi:MAG: GYD domain-containing protein [Aeromicrobium sp.]
MPKYMIQAAYTPDGLKGVLKKGGSSRREAIQSMAQSLGGSVEALYFAFGDADVYVILEMPDNVSVAAVMMTVSASGALASAKTVVLLTPEDVDEAAQKSVDYAPPGS